MKRFLERAKSVGIRRSVRLVEGICRTGEGGGVGKLRDLEGAGGGVYEGS